MATGTGTNAGARRRIRSNPHIRELAAAVQLSHKDFIQPLFADESISQRTAISSLHEVHADTPDSLLQQIADDVQRGVRKFLLFPVPAQKAERNFDYSFILSVLRQIRRQFGAEVWIAADVCLCAYTTHGHCGILDASGSAVRHDDTVAVLSDYAVQLARAGADCIAPSDMMDGRVAGIRNALDRHGFGDIPVMSYSAKFSSQFYGPFRDACRSAPDAHIALRDRRTYQISPFNAGDALLSALRDIEEGADIVMVKPALPYLDIIATLRQQTHHPIAAYHVSGEYQSLELLAQQRLVQRDAAHIEVWTALKRGGADIIISYAARHAREWISAIRY